MTDRREGARVVGAVLHVDAWKEPLADAFRAIAGRLVRWTLKASGVTHTYEGRAPHPRRWPVPDDPCLLLRPGSTDAVHVLAEMALHLRVRDGQFFLARRRWYEVEDLDSTRLGPGPLRIALEVLE
jgi:hypothetical protein